MSADAEQLLNELHAEHAAVLYRFCLRLTGNDAARAEDVLQETLLRAWRAAPKLERSAGSVRSWLFTVARNIVIDEWRSQRNKGEVVLDELPETAGADQTDQLLSEWLVVDALTQLSPEHRAVLLECYFRGSSVADAGRRLGIPPGTVKSRTHYALRSLKLALEERGVSQ